MRRTSLPLSALLSHALVAFTIEADNEAERRLHARTSARPFLVSLVMWYNCMRYVGEDGIGRDDLLMRARTATNLAGMQRWHYIDVDERGTIRATKLGRLARRIWTPLAASIEERWSERFGSATVAELRAALQAIARGLNPSLPDCLPILHYGLRTKWTASGATAPDPACDDLPALLARVLLAFALDVEARSEPSLALAANVLRVLDDRGALQRDLPRLSGVSKEAIAMATGVLSKQKLVTFEIEARTRAKRFRPTAAGLRARDESLATIHAVESAWSKEARAKNVARLRAALHGVLERRDDEDRQLIARSLEPPPAGWRARKPYAAQTARLLRDPAMGLPQFPMILHRGGWPDGS